MGVVKLKLKLKAIYFDLYQRDFLKKKENIFSLILTFLLLIGLPDR